MSKSKEAKQANEKFKTEAAKELGVNLSKQSGNITAKQAGSIGGRMVRKMVEEYEKNLKNK